MVETGEYEIFNKALGTGIRNKSIITNVRENNFFFILKTLLKIIFILLFRFDAKCMKNVPIIFHIQVEELLLLYTLMDSANWFENFKI